MKILVCGGRDFTDLDLLARTLAAHQAAGMSMLCHGDARGADSMAGAWGDLHLGRLNVRKYPCTPAEWERYGKRAGNIRNARMLNDFRPLYVVAFPGGDGTADMCWQAERAGVLVIPVTA